MRRGYSSGFRAGASKAPAQRASDEERCDHQRHDRHDIDENVLVQVSETEYIADARIEIDEFERKFGLDLNESGVETLGGLITKKLDALPKVGNIVHIGEIELVVTAADKRKIKKNWN